ncbi:MAG: ABC transporter ATP-binding protein, partial [Gemmatimonadaceae bacterium]|nr:ABC transporter ATP-binding protein [Gemmatimonadaceae bacterium]
LLSLAVIPPIVITLRLHMKPMLERSYEQQQIEGRLYSLVEQTLSAIVIVKTFRRETETERSFRDSARELLDATLASTRVQLRFKVLAGLATASGTAAILWVGGSHALDGRLTIGGVLVFLTYLRGFYAPLNTIAYAPPTVQQAAGSARRVLEVLEHEPEVAERPSAVELNHVNGRLHFENVHVGYEPDRTILHAVDLELEPGEMAAIVGRTGAGKTTLVSLVPRFLDPWEGRVSIDGTDIREFTLASLRKKIAIVSQDVFLFPRTVAENIAYGRPGAEMAEVEAAARSAQADEFIRRLPQGYETVLGERGATLSGGERQRISIARAFLTAAPILILDEPTSALDTETEAMLVQALTALRHGRTVLVIAHRLSTVKNADKVVVLEDGQIVECGPPADLIAARGRYSRFHMLQSGLIGDDRTVSVAVE